MPTYVHNGKAPDAAKICKELQALALTTTLAGNFLLVGSIANLIVAERAAASGVRFGFADHLRAGVPMTVVSAIAAALWAARELGATHAQTIRHATSGDVSGDYSAVVGYGAALLWKS